jgi:hypothetical protein
MVLLLLLFACVCVCVCVCVWLFATQQWHDYGIGECDSYVIHACVLEYHRLSREFGHGSYTENPHQQRRPASSRTNLHLPVTCVVDRSKQPLYLHRRVCARPTGQQSDEKANTPRSTNQHQPTHQSINQSIHTYIHTSINSSISVPRHDSRGRVRYGRRHHRKWRLRPYSEAGRKQRPKRDPVARH